MSLIEIVFEIGLGAWLVLVIMFLWAIERRLAGLERAGQLRENSSAIEPLSCDPRPRPPRESTDARPRP